LDEQAIGREKAIVHRSDSDDGYESLLRVCESLLPVLR
jgi:hypothetical protein